MTKNHKKILVIEDNEEVLDGIKSILEYCEYPYEGVTRFDEEVYKKLKDGRYSLIILDVMLSGNDGRDLVKELKSSEETSQVPILMVSAYPNVRTSVKKAGADDFLKKPFGLNDLKQKVEQIL